MKKTTHKLLSLLLAVIMVIGIFPATAFAADGKAIDSVEINGVREPVMGKQSSEDYTIPDEYGYGLYGDCYWYESSEPLTNIKQALTQRPSGGWGLNSSARGFTGKFQANKYYTFVMLVQADIDDGYRFNSDFSKVTVTVNGKPANKITNQELGWDDDCTEDFFAWITFGPMEAIDYASVLLDPPVAGAVPDQAEVLFQHQKHWNTIWYETEDPIDPKDVFDDLNNGLRDNHMMTASDATFKAGQYYTARVILYPDNSSGSLYYFDKYTIGYINGGEADAMRLRDDGVLEIVRSFGQVSQAKITALWNGYKATWTPVNNASSYQVTLFDKDGNTLTAVNVTGTSYDFSTYVKSFGAGEYRFTVFAKDATGNTIGSGISPKTELKAVLTGLKVKTKPTMSYDWGEAFDPSGLVLTAEYSDGTTEDIPYSKNDTRFSFENDTAADLEKASYEYHMVTMHYTEGSVTIEMPLFVWVNGIPELGKIVIAKAPTKTLYQPGDTFNPSGMLVYAYSYDQENVLRSTKTLNSGDYTVTPETLTTGTDEVTISYTEGGITKTATTPVTVANVISEIGIDITPNEIPPERDAVR